MTMVARGETQVLPLYPDTEEIVELNSFETVEDENESKKPRWKKIVKYVMLASAYVPAQFVAENISYVAGSRDTIAPVINGCESPELASPELSEWEPTDQQTEALIEIERNISSVTSAAGKFRPASRPVNTADRGSDIFLAPWNFDKTIDKFTMESSGIIMHVRTNQPDSGITINREALEEAFNEPMRRWYVFTDKSTRDFFYCSQDQLLNHKRKAGATVNLLLPAGPNYCIDGMYAVAFADNTERNGTCSTSGFNIPNLDYGWLTPFVEPPHVIFVTGRNTQADSANRSITQTFLHESAHEIMRLMDAEAYLRQDEQLAEMTQDQLNIARNGSLEPAINYPDRS